MTAILNREIKIEFSSSTFKIALNLTLFTAFYITFSIFDYCNSLKLMAFNFFKHFLGLHVEVKPNGCGLLNHPTALNLF